MQNLKSWKTVLLLSIIVPVGLLATFKLTGFFQGPNTIAETITAEVVEWECDRPSMMVGFHDHNTVENVFENNEVFIHLNFSLAEYHEYRISPPYDGRDGFDFRFCVDAEVKSFTAATFALKLRPTDADSKIYTMTNYITTHNFELGSIKSIGRFDSEAVFLADLTNSSCYLTCSADWVFYDQNSGTHEVNATLEFTYKMEDVYRMVRLPILLRIVPDVGGTFDTAKSLSFGKYYGCIDNVDYVDVYAISLEEGQAVNITLIPPKDVDFDLFLYDPSLNVVASSESAGYVSEHLTCVAETSGTWYIKVKYTFWPGHNSRGIYTLSID